MRRAWGLISAGLLAMTSTSSAQISDPVALDSGSISGGSLSPTGIRVFKGIPFAAPPVGDLRWRAPQPVANWEGVREADEFGNVCIQPPGEGRLNIAVLPDSPPLSEDCLFLNVWTGAESPSERRPVMVYVFGGAFTEGAGSVPLYDGNRLAEKGAVVVTLNYRLGPFGFFVHPELTEESGRNSSGNYGLMDTLAALRWVQRNISAFGGDPANVTLFGQSAGAMAVAALVGSSEANGLFRRAIAQSGAWMGLRIGAMRTRAQAEEQGLAAAAELGASSISELRAKSGEEIQGALRGSGTIVDGWVITEDVSVVFAEGRQNEVDVLVGSNKDEGSFVPGGPTAERWESQARDRWADLAEKFLTLYPAGSDAEAAVSSAAAFSDELSWHMRLFAQHQAEMGKYSYVFYFTQSPPTAREKRQLGATHAAEVPYVFNNLGQLPLFPDGSSAELAAASAPDQALADLMSSYWVNFARSGDPNAEGLPRWPGYSDIMNGRAMILSENAMPESDLDAAKLALYDALYERHLSVD